MKKFAYKTSAILLLIVMITTMILGQSVQAVTLEIDQDQIVDSSNVSSDILSTAEQELLTDIEQINIASDGCTYIYQTVMAGQHCNDSTMLVGNYNDLTYHSYVHFAIEDIASSIINNATLRVYYSNETTPNGTFTLYGVAQTWSAETITYTNQPYVLQLGTAVADEEGYVEFDITQTLTSVIIGQYQGYGFKISYNGGATPETVHFYTTNYSVDSKKPQMVIDGSLYAFGSSDDSTIDSMNNCGTFEFLIPDNAGTDAETSEYSSQLPANALNWEIYNISTTGYSLLFSMEYPTKVLSCDSSGDVGLTYNMEFFDAPEEYRWNIFKYSDNEYVLRNAASGKILTVSGDSVTATNTFTGLSAQKWRIGYTCCSSMAIQAMDVFIGAYIPYTSIIDNINFNNGNGIPTNADNPAVYEFNTTSTQLVTLETAVNGGIAIGSQGGTATIVIERKDTDATCVLKINIAVLSTSYFIENVASGYYIAYNNSTYSTQQGFVGGAGQQWVIEPQSSGYVMFKNVNTNRYLQVYNNASSSNAPLVFANQNTSAQGQLFRMICSRSGVYNIMAKSGEVNNYYIGAQTELLNAFIGQGSLNAVDTALGEWHLIPTGEKDATLVAVPEEDRRDRSTFFSAAQEDLERMDFDEVYQNHAVRETPVDENEVLYHMANSKIIVIRTHGNWNLITTSDGAITISDIQALDDNFFDYTQLVIYGACLTGKGGETEYNLVTVTETAGVDTVIGFEDSVYALGCNIWCEAFFNALADFAEDPLITIDDIVYCAGQELLQYNADLYYHFNEETGEITGCSRPVVKGSQEIPN